MIKLFMIWTTFICSNGEIASIEGREAGEQRFFSTNLYSSKLYTNEKDLNKAKDNWRNNYTTKKLDHPKACIGFMIQHEEVSGKQLLKHLLRIY